MYTRTVNLYDFDNQFRSHRGSLVAGIDEVGRGTLAGPVVAACVILPPTFNDTSIDDSKRLSAAQREAAARIIRCRALAAEIGFATHFEVDRYNVLGATYLAMTRAVRRMPATPDVVLVDGPQAPAMLYDHRCIVDGDRQSLAIAAASILAKVFRDRFMKRLHRLYPQYAFARNKGYGTADHLAALRQHGACPIHRMSFAPVRACCYSERQLV